MNYKKEELDFELDENDLDISNDYTLFYQDSVLNERYTLSLYNNYVLIDQEKLKVIGLMITDEELYVATKNKKDILYVIPIDIAIDNIWEDKEHNKYFVRENLNPSNKVALDSYIQAYAKISNISWEESFKELANFAYKISETMTDMKTFSKFLMQKGYKREYVKGSILLKVVKAHKNGIAVNNFLAVAIINKKYYSYTNFDKTKITYIFKRDDK